MRTRALSIDTTKRQIFTGVTSTAASTNTAASILASGSPSTKTIAASANAYLTDTIALGGAGISFGSQGGAVSSVRYSIAAAGTSTGRYSIVFRTGVSYQAATVANTTSNIAANTLSGTITPTIILAPGELLFIDVVYSTSAPLKPKGFRLDISYFSA